MTTTIIRNEIKNEINNAVKNGLTSGNIVTSDGKVIQFRITYFNFGTKITIVKGNHNVYDVNYAVSAALYEYGYTKYYRAR